MRTRLPGSPPAPPPAPVAAEVTRRTKRKTKAAPASELRLPNSELARLVAGIRPAVLQFATPPCLGDPATAHAAFLDWVRGHAQPLPPTWQLAWQQFTANAEGGMRNAEFKTQPAPRPSPSPFVGQGERAGVRGAAPIPDSELRTPPSAALAAAARRLAALRAGTIPAPAPQPEFRNPQSAIRNPDPAPLTGGQLEQIIVAALQSVAGLHIVREYRRLSPAHGAAAAIREAFGQCGASDPHGGWDTLRGVFTARPHHPEPLTIPWPAVAAVADRVVLPDLPSPFVERGERAGVRGEPAEAPPAAVPA